MLSKTVTSTNYCIDVDPDWLVKQWRRDSRVAVEDSVHGKLDAIEGITKIKYEPQFGAYVFLTLDVENDTSETWAKIEKIIP